MSKSGDKPRRQIFRRAVYTRKSSEEGLDDWGALSPLRKRVILLTLVQRIEVRRDRVDIHLLSSRIGAVLEDRPTVVHGSNDIAEGASVLTLPVAADLRRAGKEVRMVSGPPAWHHLRLAVAYP